MGQAAVGVEVSEQGGNSYMVTAVIYLPLSVSLSPCLSTTHQPVTCHIVSVACLYGQILRFLFNLS
jgi:hypothetical protein